MTFGTLTISEVMQLLKLQIDYDIWAISYISRLVFGISEFVIAYQAKFNIIQTLFPALFHLLERSEIGRILICSKHKSS